jgi:two-component system alkaline phosphatase synthesis response regulator PhoP
VKKVLVVDDEPAVRAVVRDVLFEEGYAVLEASDGRAMLELLAHEHPDLVLMDVMMPGLDGREAYRMLRSRDDLSDIPVVMMSAGVNPSRLDPSIAAFLAKPFNFDHLMDTVVGLIGHPNGNYRA